jgi:WhiB family redox-sensing transcriptional regulator
MTPSITDATTEPTRPARDGPTHLVAELLAELRPGDGDAGDWQDRALCAQTDPDAFFPPQGTPGHEPKQICRRCEVRAECLEYALRHDQRHGIWGGLSAGQRRRLARAAPGPDTAIQPAAGGAR